MAKRLTKAEQYAQIPPEKLIQQGRLNLEKMLSAMRYGYTRRAAVIKRSGLYSFAQEGFLDSRAKETRNKKPRDLTLNQLVLEIARLQNFFNAETSSVAGIKKVNLEQDIRIFGADPKTGRPLNSMTQDERRDYWDLYNDFTNANSIYSTQQYSESVQMMLADSLYNDTEFSQLNLADKLKALREKMDKAYLKASGNIGGNISRGRGNNR